MFTIILGFTALLVAGCAAYFSVLGIATLFLGSYYQVMVMAGSLEISKLVATSYLYRYWNKTTFMLKTYLIVAILVLMGITSLGIFGYLSAAYQTNASKNAGLEQQAGLFEQQKVTINNEIQQITQRINTLNAARTSQEQRLPTMSRQAAAPIYQDIQRAGDEIKSLNERIQELNTTLLDKDTKIGELKATMIQSKDIGTFKFIAQAINKPLDTVVKYFILIIVLVFDPLAVSLVLAYNVASRGTILKEEEAVTESLKQQKQPVEPNKIHVVGKLR